MPPCRAGVPKRKRHIRDAIRSYLAAANRLSGVIIMKAILGAGFALALLTGHALAQTPPQLSDAPPPPGSDGARRPPDDQAGPRDGSDMRPRRMGRFGPPPSKAARFHIETGDVEIGITCADDEPMKTCADFTLQLFDKIAALPRH